MGQMRASVRDEAISEMSIELANERTLRERYEQQCSSVLMTETEEVVTESETLQSPTCFSFLQPFLADRKKQNDMKAVMIDLKCEIDRLKSQSATFQDLYLTTVRTHVLHEKMEEKAKATFERDELMLELENLTQSLFEEANRMVSEEARLRNQLQTSNVKLTNALERTLGRLHDTLYAHWYHLSASRVGEMERPVMRNATSLPDCNRYLLLIKFR